MHARDASGRQISLLNDDSSSYLSQRPQRPLSYHSAHGLAQQHCSGSASSSPNTPELLRSDSYDSQASNDPVSPLTPSVDYSPRHYSISHEYGVDVHSAKTPPYAESVRSASFDDDLQNQSALGDRPSKRYPCRYRDSHGCEKTFTTSGHASRHSKIHTAEKAVHCTFVGCQKKFTRADNMKQHLETHYKEKSRIFHRPTAPESRPYPSARISASSRRAARRDAKNYWEIKHESPLPKPVQPSPNAASEAWDMRSLNLPLLNRPVAERTPSGLDALAMAVACQEGVDS
ncbi:hypothetical protein QQX98_001720 [Neonectria punicea]|uniref:C2H2-type domain-containing protein n=1 Tax=Neonectria punicea TaxID=979145 RepID=A0ABR1HMI6_9HYPO